MPSPSTMSSAAITICEPEDTSVVSATAPTNAPNAPGMPITATSRQSTLPARQWLSPETSPVPILAAWVLAEAATAE